MQMTTVRVALQAGIDGFCAAEQVLIKEMDGPLQPPIEAVVQGDQMAVLDFSEQELSASIGCIGEHTSVQVREGDEPVEFVAGRCELACTAHTQDSTKQAGAVPTPQKARERQRQAMPQVPLRRANRVFGRDRIQNIDVSLVAVDQANKRLERIDCGVHEPLDVSRVLLMQYTG